MALPPVNWTAVQAHLQEIMDTLGSEADFTLRSGEIFSMRVAKGSRQDTELTPGLDQNQSRVRFLHSDWVTRAPANREPEKGDQLEVWGRRHAIQSAHRRGIGDQGALMWVCIVRG